MDDPPGAHSGFLNLAAQHAQLFTATEPNMGTRP
jgi:hypothetical protein